VNQHGDGQCGHASGGGKNADEHDHDGAAALLSCVLCSALRSNDDEGLDAFAKLEL
jgi:hypothetical protein